MKIELSDLVSVTDLGRDLSGYISQASQAGRRVVILNRNVPTAALVSIADLERLDDLERLATDQTAEFPPSPSAEYAPDWVNEIPPLPPVPPGCTRLGAMPDGPADIPLSSTLIVLGGAGSGTSVALSAAIANANPDPTAPPTELIVVTDRAAVWMSHKTLAQLPVAIRPSGSTELRMLISSRMETLRASKCNTIDEYRAEHPDQPMPDIIIAATDVDAYGLDRLVSDIAKILGPASLREVGLSFWSFTHKPPFPHATLRGGRPRYYQVALGTTNNDLSRKLFNSTVAATKGPRPPGHGYCNVSGDDPSTPSPILIQAPDSIDKWRLETTETSTVLPPSNAADTSRTATPRRSTKPKKRTPS